MASCSSSAPGDLAKGPVVPGATQGLSEEIRQHFVRLEQRLDLKLKELEVRLAMAVRQSQATFAPAAKAGFLVEGASGARSRRSTPKIAPRNSTAPASPRGAGEPQEKAQLKQLAKKSASFFAQGVSPSGRRKKQTSSDSLSALAAFCSIENIADALDQELADEDHRLISQSNIAEEDLPLESESDEANSVEGFERDRRSEPVQSVAPTNAIVPTVVVGVHRISVRQAAPGAYYESSDSANVLPSEASSVLAAGPLDDAPGSQPQVRPEDQAGEVPGASIPASEAAPPSSGSIPAGSNSGVMSQLQVPGVSSDVVPASNSVVVNQLQQLANRRQSAHAQIVELQRNLTPVREATPERVLSGFKSNITNMREAIDHRTINNFNQGMTMNGSQGKEWLPLVARLAALPKWFLLTFSVIPSQRHWLRVLHCTAVAILTAGLTAALFEEALRSNSRDVSAILSRAALSDVVGGICCLVGLGGLWLGQTNRLLGPDAHVLETYARDHKLYQQWQVQSTWQLLVPASLVMMRILASVIPWRIDDGLCYPLSAQQLGIETTLKCLLDVIFAVLLAYQLHISTLLNLMVDKSCKQIITFGDAARGVQSWNLLRSLLRRSASTMEVSIFATSTAVLADMFFAAVPILVGAMPAPGCGKVWAGRTLPPVLIRAAAVVFSLSRAANVTAKCVEIPRIIGAVNFSGSWLDRRKQYLINHMESSAAGFYLKGVQLQQWQVFRGMYFIMVFCLYVVTRAFA